ncbi:MAG: tyrosine--tRNA ligase [Candidatus Pacebacteria bacterium]|nr:tyrosine--tRNA ligase [Candidatus Paceibacterota bacterium]
MEGINTDPEKIKQLLSHNVEELIVKESLEAKLKLGKKLRIKLGCDPSRPDLHLGHSIAIRKLREFQDLGHQVVFIIGDYTGMIGDPTGKSKTRNALTREEVAENAKSYLEQVGQILDLEKTELRYNSEWFAKLTFEEVLKLTGKFTVARILERDDFDKRLKSGTDIAVTEMLYPMMQAYDSIMVEADIEVGGTDQKFNLLAGRELQKKMGMAQQDVMTCPLLVGLDGVNKMSKSLDNYIGITEDANSMFGKIMSIGDDMIFYYFKLLTTKTPEELKTIEETLSDKNQNPRDLKVELAKAVIAIYHSPEEAVEAEQEFNRIFREKQKPTEIPEIKLTQKEYPILDLLTEAKMITSKSDGRRLIEQEGVRVNDEVQSDVQKNITVENGMVIQVGKRKFVKISVS